ncbi:hypothetical protein L7F22_042074 [Adiantum nelumboides]|nr:hypothetical protein [Adiantum nelumboides]
MLVSVILLFLAISEFVYSSQPHSPPVQVQLRSPWPSPPLVLEILEAVHEENENTFFDLINHLLNPWVLNVNPKNHEGDFASISLLDATDEDVFRRARNVIKQHHMLPTLAQELNWNASLALRTQVPKISAFWQLYQTSGVRDRHASRQKSEEGCGSWVDFEGKVICSDAELIEAFEAFSGHKNDYHPFPPITASDHILKTGSKSGPIAILYADPYTSNFWPLHHRLTEYTLGSRPDHAPLQYILRWKPSRQLGDASLPGYGAYLDLKKVDYLVIDDRKLVEADGSTAKSHTVPEDILHSADVQDRDWLNKQLRATTDDKKQSMGSLTKEEVSTLGLKAAYNIMKSSDPLRALHQLSQDFPSHAVALARSANEPKSAFLEEMETLHMTRIEAGGEDVWMNGKSMSGKEFQPFGLLAAMRNERTLMQSFASLNVSNQQAFELLTSADVSSAYTTDDSAPPPFFDASDRIEKKDGDNDTIGAISYWNDLEDLEDQRYGFWPVDLRSLLRPMYPGSFPQIRRNVFNVIIAIDLRQVDAVKFLSETVQMASNKIAIRWGIVPFLSTSPESSQLADLFWLALDQLGPSDTAKYLRRVAFAAQQIQSETVDVRRAGEELDKMLHTTSTEREELVKSTESIALKRQKVVEWIKRLRADETPTGTVFVNGQLIPFHPQLLQILHQVIAIQVQSLAKLIYYGEINDEETDVSTFFYDLPTTYTARSNLLFPPEEGPIQTKAIELTGEVGDVCRNALSIGPENSSLAVWLVGDVELEKGKKLLDILSSISDVQQFRLGSLPSSSLGLGQTDDTSGILINGRLLYNFDATDFTQTDFEALIKQEATKVSSVSSEGRDPWQTIAVSSIVHSANFVKKSEQGFFVSSSTVRTTVVDDIEAKQFSFSFGNRDTSSLRFSVLVDPLGKSVQKWSGILSMLATQPDVYVRVILNPQQNVTEVPLKRYYRDSTPSHLQFNTEGHVFSSSLTFNDMPNEAVLTMGLDAPPTWLTMPVDAIYDLDNIRLRDAVTPVVRAVYELKYVLIEGHVRENKSKSVPRGLQLVLESLDGTQTLDTIVMANLAYFQFRAAPGVYRLRIREGRSSDLFDMISVGNAGWDSPTIQETGDEIILNTFEGLTIFPRMSKKKGKEKEQLVEDGESSPQNGETKSGILPGNIFQRAQSILSSASSKITGSESAQVNVFTVASGHLYERMTYIMILSTLKHTKASVKFWFIENFLSPSFKRFIPLLAKEYKFDYELVTYAWPHWLRGQSEKQRSIWGMKVLFLDVLFPLDLQKVIFVDADQIVRADLLELVETDLHGAPYGFPPMGNDSIDMDNFRFWETGYWEKFLRGKPYPISALFVVDLNRFRLVAAGDKLRGHYQALSADPNSLSNLDQDLVASMIHNVPIFSLDKEWLWCETWCSWSWYDDAKSIDLCSNPKTHEPKLDRARRQIPEWTPLDEEVAELAIRMEKEGRLDANVVATTSTIDNQPQATHRHDEL